MTVPDPVRAAAAGWVVRVEDPAFSDWEAFTQWLEANPAHSDAFHQLSAAVETADPLLAQVAEGEPVPEVLLEPKTQRYRMLALVASVVLFAGVTLSWLLAPAFTSDRYMTAPGEVRTIALNEGNVLTLNGDTQIALAGLRRDQVRVERGQLLLKLAGPRHMTVRAGDLTFVDIGTTFEVTRDWPVTRLEVTEGTVVADPGTANVRVEAGQMLESRDGARTLRAQPAVGQAGAWLQGQLSYTDAPVTQVVNDLHRSTGVAFFISPAMSARRFTGTLSIKDVRADPSLLGPLLGASVSRAGKVWVIEGGS